MIYSMQVKLNFLFSANFVIFCWDYVIILMKKSAPAVLKNFNGNQAGVKPKRQNGDFYFSFIYNNFAEGEELDGKGVVSFCSLGFRVFRD